MSIHSQSFMLSPGDTKISQTQVLSLRSPGVVTDMSTKARHGNVWVFSYDNTEQEAVATEIKAEV